MKNLAVSFMMSVVAVFAARAVVLDKAYLERVRIERCSVFAEIIDLVDKYIDNNALKWVLMHGENPRMRGEWRFQR